MKKFISLALASILMAVGFAGCKNNSEVAKSSDLNIVALKGPTTMGISKIIDTNKDNNYQILGTADEAAVKLTKGEADMALIPANLAATLYNKTNGQIKVCGINTLGVLYVVENGETISSIKDLKGKTIVSTGKGTTPQYTLNYILEQNGINPETDVNIEYKSEATEVAAMLNTNKASIAVLPQPYVTAVQAKNENIRIALDLDKEWSKVNPGSNIVTGVVVARVDALEKKKDAIDKFLDEYITSVNYVNTNVEDSAKIIGELGIATEPIAKKAIPYCNIVFIEGSEMETMLNKYLGILYSQNPKSIGGKLIDENFYYKR